MNKNTAILMLAIMVFDLGYKSDPVYGYHSIRHQMMWENLRHELGDQEMQRLIHDFQEAEQMGKNGIGVFPNSGKPGKIINNMTV